MNNSVFFLNGLDLVVCSVVEKIGGQDFAEESPLFVPRGRHCGEYSRRVIPEVSVKYIKPVYIVNGLFSFW